MSGVSLAPEAQQVMILEMGKPPAFATLVVSETYQLDYDLTLTTVAVGSMGLLVMLPFGLLLLET